MTLSNIRGQTIKRLFSIAITMAMAIPGVIGASTTIFRYPNVNSLMIMRRKIQEHFYLCRSSNSRRLSMFRKQIMKPRNDFAFISTFAFSKQTWVPRANIQSKLPTSWFHLSSTILPHNNPNLSRRSISSLNSCAPKGINDTANPRELISKQIPPGTTIQNALRSSLQILEEHSIPEPDESVLHLLSHALDLSWENGYRQLRDVLKLPPSIESLQNSKTFQTQPILELAQQKLTIEQSSTYQSLLERRLQHEPLQYIVGKWDFHYLTGLKIRKPMLCPRPETEELVELVLADIDELIKQQNITPGGERKVRVLDVGCGTGAIGIAIAYRYPELVQVVALDVLPEAVELSNENAFQFLSGFIKDNDGSKEGVESTYKAVLCSAEDFTNNPKPASSSAATDLQQTYAMDFDIVVSNPPYIPMKDMRDLSTDVVGFESHHALCGGDDGLNVIRDIVHRLPEWVSSTTTDQWSGGQRHCWMEVDDSHPSMMAEWLAPGSKESARWGVEYCTSQKDFCGRDRFVKLKVLNKK